MDSSPALPATPLAIAVAIPALPADASHEEHASRWHIVLRALEDLLALGTNPAVMALLSPKYQGYAAAAAAVESVAVSLAQ